MVVCARLIHAAALTHTSKDNAHKVEVNLTNLKKLGRPLLLILAFIFIYFLFFYLNIKEVLSAWSAGKLVFVPEKPFYEVSGFGSSFLMILLLVQVIWGAFFIK